MITGRSFDPSGDLARLVRSVMWPGFDGFDLPEWVRAELAGGLAGVVFFAQNLDEGDPGRGVALSRAVRAANPAALIGVDEEGGSVTRLEAGTGSTLPGAAQLGFVDDVAGSRAVGEELAHRVATVGASVVLAPDADVNVDPRNPVIGVRSFGQDPQRVAAHAVAVAQGIQDADVGYFGHGFARVAACPKHYPGHGDTRVDSHLGVPTYDDGPQRLAQIHGVPFRALVEAGVPAIMTAHLRVAGCGRLPATLNPQIIGQLRDDGFAGVVITDALDMASISREYGMGRGAVLALLAGVDLICLGNPGHPGDGGAPNSGEELYHHVFSALMTALEDGTLPRKRLEEAAARVEALAKWTCNGDDPKTDVGEPAADIGAASVRKPEEHRMQELVERAVTVRGGFEPLTGPVLVLDIRDRITRAVATGGDFLTAELNRLATDPGATTPPARRMRWATGAPLHTLPARPGPEEQTVVLVDRIAVQGPQHIALERLTTELGELIIVNVGLALFDAAGPGAGSYRWSRVAPLIETRSDSRASARVVAQILRRTGNPHPAFETAVVTAQSILGE